MPRKIIPGQTRKRLRNGLTPKQNKLKNVLLEQIEKTGGTNITQAGLAVYNTKDRATAHQVAREALENPKLAEVIEKALNKANATPSKLLDNIASLAHATPKEYKDSTVLKANIALLKISGVDVTGQKTTHTKTTKTTIQQLGFDESKQQLRIMTQESTEFLDELDSS